METVYCIIPIAISMISPHPHFLACTSQSQCETDHGNVCPTRTMVFVLDTSGSVGPTNFRRMTQAISNFVPLLCDNIQLAILSYSNNYHVEFCFNCYNLCHGCSERSNVSSVIKNITFRSGGTRTGPATRCVRDYILDPNSGCGVNTSSECVDIIYITDGHSNGPLRYPQTCTEATCLKNHQPWCGKVNTYAIAIGNGVNQAEIQCLTQNKGDSIFNVANFEAFSQLVDNSIKRLENDPDYTCVDIKRKSVPFSCN